MEESACSGRSLPPRLSLAGGHWIIGSYHAMVWRHVGSKERARTKVGSIARTDVRGATPGVGSVTGADVSQEESRADHLVID